MNKPSDIDDIKHVTMQQLRDILQYTHTHNLRCQALCIEIIATANQVAICCIGWRARRHEYTVKQKGQAACGQVQEELRQGEGLPVVDNAP